MTLLGPLASTLVSFAYHEVRVLGMYLEIFSLQDMLNFSDFSLAF